MEHSKTCQTNVFVHNSMAENHTTAHADKACCCNTAQLLRSKLCRAACLLPCNDVAIDSQEASTTSSLRLLCLFGLSTFRAEYFLSLLIWIFQLLQVAPIELSISPFVFLLASLWSSTNEFFIQAGATIIMTALTFSVRYVPQRARRGLTPPPPSCCGDKQTHSHGNKCNVHLHCGVSAHT